MVDICPSSTNSMDFGLKKSSDICIYHNLSSPTHLWDLPPSENQGPTSELLRSVSFSTCWWTVAVSRIKPRSNPWHLAFRVAWPNLAILFESTVQHLHCPSRSVKFLEGTEKSEILDPRPILLILSPLDRVAVLLHVHLFLLQSHFTKPPFFTSIDGQTTTFGHLMSTSDLQTWAPPLFPK